MSSLNSPARALFVVVIACAAANAQSPSPAQTPLKVGEPGWAGVATGASGAWAAEFPFEPATYGKTRGYSPGTTRTTPKLVVYCRSLDPQFMDLAERLDSLVAGRPELKSSGVYLFDTKGSQLGGYTTEELAQRIKEIRKLSDEHKLKSLSVAIAANSSPESAARVGLTESENVAIVYFTPHANPNRRTVVTWLRAVKTADLDKKTIDAIVKSLTEVIEAKNSRQATRERGMPLRNDSPQ